jgi:UDP-GlcNAc:undecaprenyl-phosphate/decaprenyl-phosphate GlcNAc-1-phosphate transferase
LHDYVLTILVTAAVTYLLTPLVRRMAVGAGAMHEARDRDVHVVPIPLWGGLAMYAGMAAGLLVADQIPGLRSNAFASTGVGGLLLAGGLIVIVGMADDRWGLSALTKFAGQVAAGAILVATGTQLSALPEPGGGTFSPTPNQSTIITILVVVVTINAVNFIDGLDGLAAGIVAIAAISFFLYYYYMTKVVLISSLAAPALASAALIGMCVGFLPHNFYPAKIFMGDAGAMLLGLVLAYAPISSISSLYPGVSASQINRFPEIMPLLLPAALLVIPYGDLLFAVVRRTRAGTSPFAADRKHLHHRLLDIGHSQRTSVLIMYLWAALFSGSVVWLSTEKTQRAGSANHHGNPLLVFVAITVGALIVLLLLSMPQLRFWSRGRRSATALLAARSPDQPVVTAVPVGAGEAVSVGAAATVPAAATAAPTSTPVPATTASATTASATTASATTAQAPTPAATAMTVSAAAGVSAAAATAAANGAESAADPDDPAAPEEAASAPGRPKSVVGYVPPAVAAPVTRPEAVPRFVRPSATPRHHASERHRSETPH